MKVSNLNRYALLLNKELMFNFRGKIFSTVLNEDYILGKLTSDTIKGYKLDRRNIVKLFHLNMLQYLDYERIRDTEKDINRILEVVKYEDILINNRIIISSRVLNNIKPHLTDIWFISAHDRIIVYKSLEKKLTTYDIKTSSRSSSIFKTILRLIDNKDDNANRDLSIVIVLAGNVERAIFLYNEFGYVKMIIEAGRLAQALQDVHRYRIVNVDLNYLNRLLRFNNEKYTSIMTLIGGGLHE